MNVALAREFFMWCTVIDLGLLIFSALIVTLGGNWVYGIHGRMFPMPRETFNAAIYKMIGIFKILWVVFNLVPFIALSIIA